MLSKQNLLHLILLFCSFHVISSLGVCKCSVGSTLDCSNLKKTVFLDSEKCGSIWMLQGNKLRRFPSISSSTISYIDISHNELGFGVLDSHGPHGFPYVKYLDISKNNVWDMSFLGEKHTCNLTSLLASNNAISDLTGIRKCTYLKTLVLENNALTSLPDKAFDVRNWQSSLLEVYLAGNPITTISSSALEGLRSLKYLDISNTNISTLQTGVFETLVSLRTLLLNNNQLLQLHENVFQGLVSLETLLLNENQLMELSKNSFQGITNLELLDLRGNQLQSFPEEMFRNLTYLQSLLLNENRLVILPKSSFQGMAKLQNLDLQGNKLQTLPEEIFDDLRSLQSLDLDDNLLEELPSRIFARLHSLLELSVRNNRLKTFPSFYGPPLKSAVFNNNSISSLDEDAVRSLLLKGFELGDIRENPVKRESTDWIKDRTDLKLTWETGNACGAVSLLDVTGYGSIEFCVTNASAQLS